MTELFGHYARIQPKELFAALVSAFFIGFVISFRDWGRATLDVTAGMEALVVSAVVAFAIILLRVAAQKWIALKFGYLTTFTINKYALPTSIVLAFFLNGIIPFTSAGEVRFKESKRLRLGQFRYGLNMQDVSVISLAAPAVCVLLMLIVKPIFMASDNFFIHKIIEVAAAIAFFGMVPINANEGFHLLVYRRWLWVLTFVFVGIYFLLILTAGVFSYIVAIIIALAAMWVYQSYFN
jgi:hypothetical protein